MACGVVGFIFVFIRRWGNLLRWWTHSVASEVVSGAESSPVRVASSAAPADVVRVDTTEAVPESTDSIVPPSLSGAGAVTQSERRWVDLDSYRLFGSTPDFSVAPNEGVGCHDVHPPTSAIVPPEVPTPLDL